VWVGVLGAGGGVHTKGAMTVCTVLVDTGTEWKPEATFIIIHAREDHLARSSRTLFIGGGRVGYHHESPPPLPHPLAPPS